MLISRDVLDCQDFEDKILVPSPLKIRDFEENFSSRLNENLRTDSLLESFSSRFFPQFLFQF